MNTQGTTPAIEMINITKTFGSIVANKNVNLTVRYGEILSLLGENGSGKTTLMNMLSGIYFPDSGTIKIGGQAVTIASPKDAYNLKIGMIHQHFKLIDVFTAAENVSLGSDKKLNLKSTTARINEICKKYGFDIDPGQKVYNMSVSQKQTLEIVKALYRGADILILDEPTAALTPQETDRLFEIIRNMRADGKAIIIITHKLHEVLSVSDRVSILRKGEYIGTVDTSEANEQILTEMMVGKKVELSIDRPEPPKDKYRKKLSVEHLSCYNADGVLALDDVSFDLYGGEILGIAGISGCGQKQLLEAIAGLQTTNAGSSIVYHSHKYGDKQLIGMDPKKIRELGVSLSFVPEDRLGMGLVGSMGMTENMELKNYSQGRSPFVDSKSPRKLAETIKDELSVVTPGINTPVRRLSGGNVQKVLVGREIAAAPSVLLTAYAVRGLDINTSYMIYSLLNEQKMKGVGIIYVGEDLDVLLELSDRILVLCGGKVNGILDARNTTKEEVGRMMTDLRRGDSAKQVTKEEGDDK